MNIHAPETWWHVNDFLRKDLSESGHDKMSASIGFQLLHGSLRPFDSNRLKTGNPGKQQTP